MVVNDCKDAQEIEEKNNLISYTSDKTCKEIKTNQVGSISFSSKIMTKDVQSVKEYNQLQNL